MNELDPQSPDQSGHDEPSKRQELENNEQVVWDKLHDWVRESPAEFDFELQYYRDGQLLNTQEIKGKPSIAAAMSEVWQGRYDEFRWTRTPQEDRTAVDVKAADREIRRLEMSEREPGLLRGILERLRSRWTNPF